MRIFIFLLWSMLVPCVSVAAMTVKDAYDYALMHQKAYTASYQRLKAALLDEEIAKSETRPQIQASLLFGNTSSQDTDSGDYSNAKLSLSTPLYNKGLKAATSVVLSRVEVTRLEMEILRQRLLSQVAGDYLNIIDAYNDYKASSEGLGTLKQQLETVRALKRQGQATNTDVLLVESQTELKKIDVEGNRVQFHNYLDAYLHTLGWTQENTHQGIYSIKEESKGEPLNVPSDVRQQILDENISIKIARINSQIANKELSAIQASRYPSVSLQAEHQRLDTGGLGLSFDQDSTTIAASVVWSIYSGGRTGAQIEKGALSLKAATSQYEDTLQEQLRALLLHQRTLKLLEGEIKAREKVLKAAQNTLLSSNASYKLGRVTVTRILDAQDDLQEALTALSQARTRYLRLALSLMQMYEVDPEGHGLWLDSWLDDRSKIELVDHQS